MGNESTIVVIHFVAPFLCMIQETPTIPRRTRILVNKFVNGEASTRLSSLLLAMPCTSKSFILQENPIHGLVKAFRSSFWTAVTCSCSPSPYSHMDTATWRYGTQCWSSSAISYCPYRQPHSSTRPSVTSSHLRPNFADRVDEAQHYERAT